MNQKKTKNKKQISGILRDKSFVKMEQRDWDLVNAG